MKNNLQSVRSKYNNYFTGTVLPLLGIAQDTLDQLSFEEIAQRIGDSGIRKAYRRLAIQLLEANLHDHQVGRPSAIVLLDAGDLCELRDWQEVTFTWERALWALASQDDA